MNTAQKFYIGNSFSTSQITILSLTGGLAKQIVPYCKRKMILDENLLLKGLYILYARNQ